VRGGLVCRKLARAKLLQAVLLPELHIDERYLLGIASLLELIVQGDTFGKEENILGFSSERCSEMALTVRGLIRAEDVLRCLMFEDNPGRRSVGCRSEVWCGGT
jgi:hypothetical protein